jgi:hypothetical protein
MGRACRTDVEEESCRILVENPEGKRPLGRPRCRWVYNIKMDYLRDRTVCYGLDSSGLG